MVGALGPVTGGARPLLSQHSPAPCCFELRDANTGRLQCLQILRLSVEAGSHWHSPQEEAPQRKPRATAKHMLHKRTAGFSEQPRQPCRNPRLSVLPNENRIPKRKKRQRKENKKDTAALEAANVSNDAPLTAFTCSKPRRAVLSPAFWALIRP